MLFQLPRLIHTASVLLEILLMLTPPANLLPGDWAVVGFIISHDSGGVRDTDSGFVTSFAISPPVPVINLTKDGEAEGADSALGGVGRHG